MTHNVLTILFMLFSFFANSQDTLDASFAKANAEMRLKNLYHKIAWGMSVLNEYEFDQSKGYVKYIVGDTMEAVAVPTILGTFNLEDQSFLWADKNRSIRKPLSADVAAFRAQLPEKYRKDTFKSTTDFTSNLLALFSSHLHANGFDSKRQGNTIVYYAILQVDVFEDRKKIKTIEPINHVTFLHNDSIVQIMKDFHREKLEINRQYHANEISSEEAFIRIKKVHLTYWLNEDSYFSPSLSWPCDFDEKSILDWQVFTIEAENRLFVAYTTDTRISIELYAYEIDPKAVGKKLIINEF